MNLSSLVQTLFLFTSLVSICFLTSCRIINSYTTASCNPLDMIIPSSYAAMSSLKFCFKRIRFKTSDSDLGNDIELDLGEVLIKEEGTYLGQVQLASGTYKRIEFDLEKDCDGTTKPSISLINDNGSFSSDDRVTIKFEGNFNPSEQDLNMFIQSFINVLKNYNLADGSLKDVLENVSGTY